MWARGIIKEVGGKGGAIRGVKMTFAGIITLPVCNCMLYTHYDTDIYIYLDYDM